MTMPSDFPSGFSRPDSAVTSRKRRAGVLVRGAGVRGGAGPRRRRLVPQEAAGLAVVFLGGRVGLVHAVAGEEEVGLRRPVHVVADEEVEPAVPVRVEPGRSRGPGGIRRARRVPRRTRHRGHVGESSPVVPVQPVVPDRRHVEVRVPVGIVVGRRPAHAVDGPVEAGLARDVAERPVAEVPQERGPGPPVLRAPLPAGAVHEEEVGPAVPVVVEHDDAAAHGLGHPLLSESARGVDEVDPRGRRDVRETDRGRRVAALARREARARLGIGRRLRVFRFVGTAGNRRREEADREGSGAASVHRPPPPPDLAIGRSSCVRISCAIRFTPGFSAL